MNTLQFELADTERMERDRQAALTARNSETRRRECYGCAMDWPVTRMEAIGASGMFHLVHTGPRKLDGACWCQCPHLHPENDRQETATI